MKVPKGLKIRQVKPGSGAIAEIGKFAIFHYDCYLPRGDKCESSRDKLHPVQLKVGQRLTYPAIAYALPGMAVGEIREVRVSPNLTYYERKQNPDLPANVMLRYEIELVAVNEEWKTETISKVVSDPQSDPEENWLS